MTWYHLRIMLTSFKGGDPQNLQSPTRPFILEVPPPPHWGPVFQHMNLGEHTRPSGSASGTIRLSCFPFLPFLFPSLPFLSFLLSLWLLLPPPNWSHREAGTEARPNSGNTEGASLRGQMDQWVTGNSNLIIYIVFRIMWNTAYILKYHFIINFT